MQVNIDGGLYERAKKMAAKDKIRWAGGVKQYVNSAVKERLEADEGVLEWSKVPRE